MPAISGQEDVHLLRPRDWQQTVGQSGMTPTAFSFLIPVFVVAIVAPFLCIFCIRKRRRPIPVTTRVTPKVKKPALRRAEAREKLKEITRVSSEVSNATRDNQETAEVESRSVMERECAICLSTLHAPSPPEPAKLTPTSSISDATIPSTTDPAQSTDKSTTTTTTTATAVPTTQPDTETILKLSVCGHEFHSECLVSWFILRKTSCPICRSMYMSTEDMEKYDQEEQIALGGTPTPTSPTSVDPEAQAAGQTQQPIAVRNWRYFIHGRDAYRREQERQARQQQAEQGQAGVELTDQSTAATAGGEAAQQAESQEQPAQTSRWRRFFSRT
ncbi:hypothetical protein yc1106_05069 [Curvularia clavata]|uniref:RING-type domain-containing protein n=1 Tax=Curvularia clavata TaxID=95742 RepID=A0A9Q8Z9U0_CURCL|nr:hypothetical protein yc1106_05069 [Curvularia clavata]